MLRCGHRCCGYSREQICTPCLHEDCVNKNPKLTLEETVDSYCIICYTQGLGEKPVIQLTCRHFFHVECSYTRISKRWPGPRIGFSFLSCPACKARIGFTSPHPMLTQELNNSIKLEKEILEKSL